MNYYPRWPGDYQRDTALLSLAEHGAYALLLDHYYSAGHPLPMEMEPLYRICRAMSAEEQAAVRRVADRFFPVNGTHRHNKRADRELRKLAARIEAAQTNGEKGGRPRLEKPSKNPVGFQNKTQQKPSGFSKQNPEHNPAITQLESYTKPITKSQKPKDVLDPTPSPDLPSQTELNGGASKSPKNGSAAQSRAPLNGGGTEPIWQSYASAYRARYGTAPVRNARINGQLTQLSARLGAEAPHVASYYLIHNGAFYTARGHPVGALLADAEKLHTEWKTGAQITQTRARQMDRKQTMHSAVTELIAEAEQETKTT